MMVLFTKKIANQKKSSKQMLVFGKHGNESVSCLGKRRKILLFNSFLCFRQYVTCYDNFFCFHCKPSRQNVLGERAPFMKMPHR